MIGRRVWTGALLAVALAGCGAAPPEGARAALEAKRSELQDVIAANPQAIAERVQLARIAIRLGDGAAAEAAVKAAVAAGGKEAALSPLLARAYAMQGDGRRAIETLNAGPIIPEMQGEAAWVAGNVHLADGDLAAAREAFDRAVRALPRDAALWVDVARYRDANADTAGARAAADHALELDAKNSAALAFKAGLVRTEEGLSASLRWYDAALEVDPANADALIERAATLGDMGRYKDMLAAVRAAAAVAPGDPRLYYLQAVVAARAGNFPLARSLLQRTRGTMDEVPAFMLLSAVVEMQLEGEAVAATWADRLLTLQPHNFAARRILAAAEWADGDADAAAAALAPIVTRPDADSWSLLLAARAAAERAEAAEPYLARAAQLTRGEAVPFVADSAYGFAAMEADAAPLDPAKAIPAIRADIASGAYGRAIERAARLRDANPGVADAHLLLGDAALAAGRLDTAIQSYRAAHSLDAGERTSLRLANALYRADDVAGSRDVIAALGRAEPLSVAADRLAGHLAMDARDWNAAILHFERVRRRTGNRDVVILRELAKARAATGDGDQALVLIDRAYRLQPLNREIMLVYADLMARRGKAQAAEDLRDKVAQIGR